MKRFFFVFLSIILIIPCISSCAFNDYNDALMYESDCEYEKAIEIYKKHLNYSDCKERLENCEIKLNCKNKILDYKGKIDFDTLTSLKDGLNEYISGNKRVIDDDLFLEGKTYSTTIEDVFTCTDVVNDKSVLEARVEFLEGTDINLLISNATGCLNDLNNSHAQFLLVNNPSEEYVVSCLKKVAGISDIECATEDNDPNGGLGGEGGYKSNIFFKCKWLSKTGTPLELGTNGGGSVEIYKTIEEASQRHTSLYLSSLQSGAKFSYMILGTLIIRISSELNELQQNLLIERITYQLTLIS